VNLNDSNKAPLIQKNFKMSEISSPVDPKLLEILVSPLTKGPLQECRSWPTLVGHVNLNGEQIGVSQ